MNWMHITKAVLSCSIVFGLVKNTLQPGELIAADNPYPKIILFVNQVRGEECCDPGTTKALSQQLAAFALHKLPATFALRYDALTPKFLDEIHSATPKHEVAAFFEITPSLALDAKVDYQGNSQNWYRAKHSYLIGYSPEDRITLIDTYMSRFNSLLDSYPKTTVAWMIDPLSLAYLSETYGVTAHEITREQWGTDSYTLHGGPPHYPYYPSSNWALIPSMQNSTMPLIFRQTVSDPLRNYGDFTSTFTSQPNDYLSGSNDFNYFKELMNQALLQPGNDYGFAVLGLENSMNDLYQKEFLKQIEYIGSLSHLDPSNQVIPTNQLSEAISSDASSIVSGKDLIGNSEAQAWWITTSTYRLRLRYDGDNLFINDIRLYNNSMTDPYLTKPTSFQNGIWISPFLLDSSRINREYGKKNRKPLTFFESLLTLNPFSSPINSQYFFEPGASPDLEKTSPAIYLPKPDDSSPFSIKRVNSEIRLRYESQNSPLELQFLDEGFYLPQNSYINSLVSTQHVAIDQSSEIISIPSIKLEDGRLAWKDAQDSIFGLTINNHNEQLEFKPFYKESIDWSFVFDRFAFAYNPEAHDQGINVANTILYAHNPQAIAGLNPVRLILQGYDDNNLPIPIKDISIDVNSDPSVLVKLHKPTQFNGGWWVDVSSQTSGSKDIQAHFDGHTLAVEAYFIEDCSVRLINCIKHPFQGAQFLKAKLFARVGSISQKW